MCLAVPGKIIEIKDRVATVDYGAERRKAKILSEDFKVGDYVFVQMQIIVQKIPKDEALKAIESWNRIIKNES